MGKDHCTYKYSCSSMAIFTSSRTSVAVIQWLTRMWLSSTGQFSDEACSRTMSSTVVLQNLPQVLQLLLTNAPSEITYSNWASEASPTLGCSIEISRDIYIFIT